ncbi:MAG: hypothetical protein ACTSR1_10460 [Candidatus Heimdallarchaeota archaeon]
MTKLTFTNIFTMILTIIAIALGPIIFLVPFLFLDYVNPSFATFFIGIDFLVYANLAKPFMIIGFAASLLTILNLYDYDPKTAKMPIWFLRLLQIISFVGIVFGIIGTLLVVKARTVLSSYSAYENVGFGPAFYLTLISFILILTGYILHWILDEQLLRKKKFENPVLIDNP